MQTKSVITITLDYDDVREAILNHINVKRAHYDEATLGTEELYSSLVDSNGAEFVFHTMPEVS